MWKPGSTVPSRLDAPVRLAGREPSKRRGRGRRRRNARAGAVAGRDRDLGVVPSQGLGLELEEGTVLDGEPGVVHHLHHETLVVDGDERG